MPAAYYAVHNKANDTYIGYIVLCIMLDNWRHCPALPLLAQSRKILSDFHCYFHNNLYSIRWKTLWIKVRPGRKPRKASINRVIVGLWASKGNVGQCRY